jgi:16S rRNA processing protein RimM
VASSGRKAVISHPEARMETPDLEFIAVGRVLATWGAKGQLKVNPETDFPQRFNPGATVYIDRKPVTIESAITHRGKLLVKLTNVDTIDDASKLVGKSMEIVLSQVNPLPEGRYYHFQLIGLEVRTTRGECLGKIIEIMTTGSNDNYVVRGAKGEILIPAIAEVVKAVDLDKGLMTVEAMDGLLSLNQKSD